jgi:hypothetical protein
MENNMENSQPPPPLTPPIQPVIPEPTVQPPIVQPPIKRSFDLRYLFLVLLIIGLGGAFFAMRRLPVSTPPPTPSDTPTPTPKLKPVTPVATQSAYLELTKGVASLSASISTMQVSDTTLTPPTVELPLGFPNE